MNNEYILSKSERKLIYYYDFVVDKSKLKELLVFDYNLSHMDAFNVLTRYQEYIISRYSDSESINIKKERSPSSSEYSIKFNTEDKELFEKIKIDMNMFENNFLTYIDIIAEDFKSNPYFTADPKVISEINIKLDNLTKNLEFAESVIKNTGIKENLPKIKI